MKAIVDIDFKEIDKIKIDKSLLKQEPSLIKHTDDVMLKLCTAFREHFKSKGIKVEVTYKIKNE